ncbi:MAG: FKBP-type peptidyl-prolyl cis-trans isomerase, partial [Bacteroidales bacterium]|nr:FKBP-type peptidyl-prolyl cis-trans isomerase [Bacteroidales bacterium]
DGEAFEGGSAEDYVFVLGSNTMIPGFEEAVKMMSEGEKGVVVIPSRLAYGARQRGEIPPFSTLIFELELVETEK